ncbi:hypothetical protein FB639_005533, partial [Coemansia asiatica]
SLTLALAATAALVTANNAPADDHQKVYTTVLGQGFHNVQPVAVQPVSVVQNAGTDDTTVTVTHTNGAASNVLSIGSAMLAGAALLSYF